MSVTLGLKSAKDLSFGRREGFLARYERANALPPRPRMPHPGADLDGKGAVVMENGRIREEEMRTNVEYLVLGHFKRKAGYTKGMHTMLWLALADFDKLGRVQRGGRR